MLNWLDKVKEIQVEVIPKPPRNAVYGTNNAKNEGFGTGYSFRVFSRVSIRGTGFNGVL